MSYLLERLCAFLCLLLPRDIFTLLRGRPFLPSGSDDARSWGGSPGAAGWGSFSVCVWPPSPGLVLVHPPGTALLVGQVSGPPSEMLLLGKCRARYTEASFSFCSTGRGRLRLKQHHVSRGSALSEGKGPCAPPLPGVSEWVPEASSGQPRGVRAERKALGWWEQQGPSPAGGPEGRPSGVHSEGPPSSLLGSQGFRTHPEDLALTKALLLHSCCVSRASLLQKSHAGVGRKDTVPLGTPASGVPVSKAPLSSPCTPFLLSQGLDRTGPPPQLSAPPGAWPELGPGVRRAPSPDSTKDADPSGHPALQRGSWPWAGFWGAGGGSWLSPWGNLRRYWGGKVGSTGPARMQGARGWEAAAERSRGSVSQTPASLGAPEAAADKAPEASLGSASCPARRFTMQSPLPGSPSGFSAGSPSCF